MAKKMPQTLNSILSPIKSMVAMGKPMVTKD